MEPPSSSHPHLQISYKLVTLQGLPDTQDQPRSSKKGPKVMSCVLVCRIESGSIPNCATRVGTRGRGGHVGLREAVNIIISARGQLLKSTILATIQLQIGKMCPIWKPLKMENTKLSLSTSVQFRLPCRISASKFNLSTYFRPTLASSSMSTVPLGVLK